MSREALAARLLAIFAGELEEQLRGMTEHLLALEASPSDGASLRALFRAAHTLKGAAHAAGVPTVETICHELEALLAQARDGTITLGEAEFAYLFSAVDTLAEAGEGLRRGEPPLPAGSPSTVPASRTNPPAPWRTGQPPRAKTPAPPAPAPPAPTSGEPAGPRAAAAPVPADGPAESEGEVVPAPADPAARQVRVETGKVDALLSSVGELLVATRRSAGRRGEMEALYEISTRSAQSWRRASAALRGAAQDPAVQRLMDEVDRGLAEMVRGSERATREAAADARVVSRLASDLGERMRRLRMQPFSAACDGLPRAVRDLANASGKLVGLEVHGAEVEADRIVVDALREALLHLVRNAVDHGIETPEHRAARGKPRAGTVEITAGLRGDRLAVTVADDGGGLDVAAVRRELERRGAPVPPDDARVAQSLFGGGLSTRSEPTEVSGRGVGLDAVRDALERVHGAVSVTWREGQGTTFLLECPSTLTALRLLLVRTGDLVSGIPTAAVERLRRAAPGELRRVDGRDVLPTSSGPVPLAHLGRLLGLPPSGAPHDDAVHVVQIESGGRRAALVVDELLSEQEAVVRPLPRLRGAPAHLTGAVILPDGRAGLVLYPAALVSAAADAPSTGDSLTAASAHDAGRPRILVADDSITTRTLEQSLLEAAGYEVTTAADGAEAWAAIQEHPFDLVVSDVEMPGMDGFDLCRAIRASRHRAELPVVLVTALENAEHRARGLEAGADAYIPKSSFDQEALLETVRQLLGDDA